MHGCTKKRRDAAEGMIGVMESCHYPARCGELLGCMACFAYRLELLLKALLADFFLVAVEVREVLIVACRGDEGSEW